MLSPLSQIYERLEKARNDSDVAYFYDLLHAGEMVVKLATAGLVACVDEDRERHRYRLEYDLAHADSLGAWSSALSDALTGPASQILIAEARATQRELTQTFRMSGPEWQPQAVAFLHEARLAIDRDIGPLPTKVGARRWFEDFIVLRNRTRGHGATTPASCSDACEPLHRSIALVLDNLILFRVPWVHLRRNLSGKYRVTDLGNGVAQFEPLKSSTEHSLPNGVHLWLGHPRLVSLLSTDDDIRDFFLPNGGFNGKTYEALSYITDTRVVLGADNYVNSPTILPVSETQGMGELEVIGEVFANLPPRVKGYIKREDLEVELATLLTDDRHPVITLVGRGGVGKTSLALEVLYGVVAHNRFFTMVWFSARDIELLPTGPKRVQPHVLSPYDMAQEYVELIGHKGQTDNDFKPLDYFAHALSHSTDAPTLFVFDNFETVNSPIELHRWLDTHIRSPNKILITTRSREFKGDYWVDVGGMTEDQFAALVRQTAQELNVMELIDDEYIAELYRESDGHPYIAKVLLGELAHAGRRQKVSRVMASQEKVLDALFDRTFTQLAPAAQRVFLTLSNWHSLVPIVALEVAVNRPENNERVDVDKALEELHRSSLLQTVTTDARDVYVSVPLSAALFGRRKLDTNPWRATIDADTEVLRLFGAVQVGGTRHGFEAQVERLFQKVSEQLQKHPDEFDHYRPVLEFVSRECPIGWIFFAELLEEYHPFSDWADEVAESYRHYLELTPNDAQIWRALAQVCNHKGDRLGEVQALVQRARLTEAPYADVSYAATRVNAHLADGALKLDTDEKRILITDLADVMIKRDGEATATDMSRLAWLLMNINRRADAKKIVLAGLERDPTNWHCQKLADKMKLKSTVNG